MRLIQDQQNLARWVQQESGHIDIAVAFWGLGAIRELQLDRPGRSFRVLLDLTAGGSNPVEVRSLRDMRPEHVRCVNRLHAKALIGEKELLIGSANASSNGLGSEGTEATRWVELGLATSHTAVVAEAQAWFNKLWTKSSRRITDEMLENALTRWKEQQRIRPLAGTNIDRDLLSAVLANPDDFRNRGLYVVVSTESLSDRANQLVAAREKETEGPAFCFEDWPAMPVDSWLICFTDYGNKGIHKDTPAVCYTKKDRQRGAVRWVDKANIPGGFRLGPIGPWRSRLEAVKAANRKAWESEGGLCMDLVDFVIANS